VDSVRITGAGQLVTLSRRLHAAGGENVKRNFARRIRRAAEPLQGDLEGAIRGLRISGRGRAVRGGPSPNTRPLRATIASAIRVTVRTTGIASARVWVDRDRLPPGTRNIPDHLNKGLLRHPTFGNKSSRGWVNNTATPLWWANTVRKGQPRMEREVARVLDDVRQKLT
jgi:hypothetical protein